MFGLKVLSALVLLVLLSHLGVCQSDDDDFLYGTFPEGFRWGSSTASYQIEGAWNISGKGENIWDNFIHGGAWIEDGSNGDVACDSYHKYEEDIQILANMGANVYRFSFSWARMLPEGTVPGGVNQPGVDYYNNLIDGLLANGVEPMVTLYHYDLPQALQDIGGWANPEMIDIFTEYADFCFDQFGDRVKLWITFNEPWVFCTTGYGQAVHAPGIREMTKLPYEVGHIVLKSHAQAWHLYDENYRQLQQGNVSIVLNSGWIGAENKTEENLEAIHAARAFSLGWFAHPIYGPGDYPPIMKEKILNKSLAQGYNESRLPEFTQEEIDYIRGTWDFYAMNHYSSEYAQYEDKGIFPVNFKRDSDVSLYQDPDWPSSGTSWLKVVPWGIRRDLNYIKSTYNNPPIWITENGMSDRNSTLFDTHRIYYLKHYINNVLKAILLDGVNVIGYNVWTLMDNFEWGSGFLEKFGLHFTNFSDPDLPRIPKASVGYYAQIIRDHGFVDRNITLP